MPQKIVMHADDMVKAAEREIETLEAADAIKLSGRDDVVFVDALPMTATGKISKKDLRAKFADHKLPGDSS